VFHQDETDDALLARAAAWPTHHVLEDLTQPELALISGREGIDFATALLYDRLLKREAIRETLAAFHRAANAPTPRDVLVGVVPGAFYKEYAGTGADGQRVLDLARRAGLRAERVPLDSFGSLAGNARILGDWLRHHQDEEVHLVSLSKGGIDTQYALSLPDAEQTFRNVTVWLNLSGMVQGTALADWLLARPIRYSFNVLNEIRRADSVSSSFAWPKHLRIFHVIGFPRRRHLHSGLARRAHRRLEAWGPNDGGGILLADAVRWPGTLIPLWGADHYLRQESYDIAALLTFLLANGGQLDTNPFVRHPSALASITAKEGP
jgi:hypothetical protein